MIVAVSVCPHPPALVPEIAPGLADELTVVRDEAFGSVRSLMRAHPDRVVVLGTGRLDEPVDETAGGTLRGFGVEVRAGGPVTCLPASLTTGAWLLDRVGWTGPRLYTTDDVPPSDDRVALLVMADGSARRDLKAPGHRDERAASHDRSVALALAAGDPEALADLDADLADQLLAAGVPALIRLGEVTKGADVVARLRCDVAPFGVGYWVADWSIATT